MTNPAVAAVNCSGNHFFSKPNQPFINLIAGVGVQGDAHAGKTVKHRYLVNKDPTKPNIRQVHLIQAELFDELNSKGFVVNPGQLGENITTRGVDLLTLPTQTKLHIGPEAVIELTALRNPCHQIDKFQKGLLKAVSPIDAEGNVIRKAGVMGIVLVGGVIRPNHPIMIDLPPEPHHPLEYVW
jgi:MOSC domain-containing protein YiiM